ncbi:unnamed protein product [Amoebophrya sp. A25]|nr:unnamed protein product [Amoebophrya sp. A25]|eukprot:GSA25T00009691001.1
MSLLLRPTTGFIITLAFALLLQGQGVAALSLKAPWKQREEAILAATTDLQQRNIPIGLRHVLEPPAAAAQGERQDIFDHNNASEDQVQVVNQDIELHEDDHGDDHVPSYSAMINEMHQEEAEMDDDTWDSSATLHSEDVFGRDGEEITAATAFTDFIGQAHSRACQYVLAEEDTGIRPNVDLEHSNTTALRNYNNNNLEQHDSVELQQFNFQRGGSSASAAFSPSRVMTSGTDDEGEHLANIVQRFPLPHEDDVGTTTYVWSQLPRPQGYVDSAGPYQAESRTTSASQGLANALQQDRQKLNDVNQLPQEIKGEASSTDGTVVRRHQQGQDASARRISTRAAQAQRGRQQGDTDSSTSRILTVNSRLPTSSTSHAVVDREAQPVSSREAPTYVPSSILMQEAFREDAIGNSVGGVGLGLGPFPSVIDFEDLQRPYAEAEEARKIEVEEVARSVTLAACLNREGRKSLAGGNASSASFLPTMSSATIEATDHLHSFNVSKIVEIRREAGKS